MIDRQAYRLFVIVAVVAVLASIGAVLGFERRQSGSLSLGIPFLCSNHLDLQNP